MAKKSLHFTADIASGLKPYLEKKGYSQVVALADVNTYKHCFPLLSLDIKVVVIPAGEVNKNFETYQFILAELVRLNIKRDAILLNIGGGVVTDIGAFVASTYMRGIAYINIPTTLIGMVDASIGGKTGIDFEHLKNYIGTFYLPKRVFISSIFLNTLNKTEIQSGWAEIIKTGIIANAKIIQMIKDDAAIDKIIKQCAQTKLSITQKDLTDKSIRMLLNYGHTIGHALESHYLAIGKPIPHGFAIAKGMYLENEIAEKFRGLTKSERLELDKLIRLKTGQKKCTKSEKKALIKYLNKDKKNQNDDILFSLPSGIGNGKTQVLFTLQQIKRILESKG